jgi:cobalt-zinc-cadmium efflux system protein
VTAPPHRAVGATAADAGGWYVERVSATTAGSHGGHGHSHGAHSHGGHGAHGGHGHGHGAHGGHGAPTGRGLWFAVVVTSSFMLVEAGVGFWSGSLSLVADAGHMLADAGALALALFAERVASRPRTERSTFGYRRAEVLAAFANGMLLAGVAVLIVKEAIERYLSPVPIHGTEMLGTAVAGLVVNLVVAAVLMRGQRDSINVRAALAHVLTDALGSVAAILAAVLVVTVGFVRADPVLSVVIAVLVAASGFRVLKETMGILLEAAPPNLNVPAVERTIRETPGVDDVHDLHVWRISERFDTLTAHVTLARGSHGTDVARRVSERLLAEHGLDHVTIQPEAPRPDDVVAVRVSRDGRTVR